MSVHSGMQDMKPKRKSKGTAHQGNNFENHSVMATELASSVNGDKSARNETTSVRIVDI